MRGISVKGVVLGNIAFWVCFIAIAVLLLIVSIVGKVVSGNTDAELSIASLAVIVMGQVLAAVVGGYIAALFAEDRLLLHGALSSALMVLLSLYGDIVGFPSFGPEPTAKLPYAVDFIASYGTPLFGMLGAYLRSLGEPRTVLRWGGAIMAAVGTYLLVIALGVALFAWWKTLSSLYIATTFAPRFSAIAGTYAVPKHQRNQALSIFIGLAGIVPTLAALGLAWGRHSPAWLLFILFNAIGCGVAYWTMRRTLARERVAALPGLFE